MTDVYNKSSEKGKRRKLRREMTKAEVLLWTELKNKKLGVRFLRQYSVNAFVLDFYSPTLRLAIEVDGATHLTDQELTYDNIRQKKIEEFGIHFMRFTNPEIYDDLGRVIEEIKRKIDELKAQPPPKIIEKNSFS